MIKKIFKIVGLVFLVVTLLILTLLSVYSVKLNLNIHKCDISEVYSFDETSHYQSCSNKRCVNKFNTSEHDLQWVIDKQETYDSNGLMHRECVCGYKVDFNTIIDELIVEDDIVNRKTYSDYFVKGGYTSETLKLGCFNDDINKNANFSARFEIGCKNDDRYHVGLAPNIKVDYLSNGFSFYDKDGNKYSIRLYTDLTNSCLKITKNSTTLSELVSDEITKLGLDFIDCLYVDVDFGVIKNEESKYIYGFRFKTANYEVSYFNDNSGSIKDNEVLEENLGWIYETGLFNYKPNPDNCSSVDLVSSVVIYSHNQGILISSDGGSSWFLNKYYFNLY